MIHTSLETNALLDLNYTAAKDLLKAYVYPWEVLPLIHDYILQLGQTLPAGQYQKMGDDIWIHKSAQISPTASITGPAIIGEGTEVRHCAFLRGNSLIGKGCVVGNSTELKNVILFDSAKVPHYNYVGDSILGHKAHMGAGSITSNMKSDGSLIYIRTPEAKLLTGMRKLGAIIGDHCEIGCGAVLNPGTILSRGCTVYPLSMVRGFLPEHSIYKKQGEVVRKTEQ